MRCPRVEQRIKRVDAFLRSMKDRLHAEIRLHLPAKTPLRVLEAGCGSSSQITIEPEWHVTGIDLSERQLSQNRVLHEKILGNIETHRWEPESFDLIVCWDVIEHLRNPEQALRNLFGALLQGGLLVLAFPHILSIKGLITKFTPYSVASAFYRFAIGETRDTTESSQFPTHMRFGILPGRITALAQEHGLELSCQYLYEGPVQRYFRALSRVANAGFSAAGLLLPIMTFGRFHPNHTDCILILKKPVAHDLTDTARARVSPSTKKEHHDA